MQKLMLKIRKFHRYVMVVLAIQMLLWFVSGLYMVSFDMDFIHGDHLVASNKPAIDKSQKLIEFSELLALYPRAQQVKLTLLAGKPVYQFIVKDEAHLVSAETGHSLLPLNQSSIQLLAQQAFTGNSPIKHIDYFSDNAPSELAARHLPAWRVTFDDTMESTLYLSAKTGQVVTKRHRYWRLFDIVWMLHIMDYQTRSDVSNVLLRVFTVTALLAALSGVILLFSRFRVAKKLAKARRNIATFLGVRS